MQEDFALLMEVGTDSTAVRYVDTSIRLMRQMKERLDGVNARSGSAESKKAVEELASIVQEYDQSVNTFGNSIRTQDESGVLKRSTNRYNAQPRLSARSLKSEMTTIKEELAVKSKELKVAEETKSYTAKLDIPGVELESYVSTTMDPGVVKVRSKPCAKEDLISLRSNLINAGLEEGNDFEVRHNRENGLNYAVFKDPKAVMQKMEEAKEKAQERSDPEASLKDLLSPPATPGREGDGKERSRD